MKAIVERSCRRGAPGEAGRETPSAVEGRNERDAPIPGYLGLREENSGRGRKLSNEDQSSRKSNKDHTGPHKVGKVGVTKRSKGKRGGGKVKNQHD